jgi:hypothetical protein
MNKKVCVHVRAKVNSASIRRERRNGRDVIVVPSATMPDNIIMNGIRYPAEEIEKSYASLERTPAPLGHPNIDGAFVSASDPEGITRGFIGAWNTNVRRTNGRVFLDKVIDVEFAKQLEGGRAVLDAIEKGEPISTSTGLFCMLEPVANADEAGYEAVASDIVFDHDAILLGEDPAASPEQGVGMLVNSTPTGKTPVVNSVLEYADQELDWAGLRLIEALDRAEKASVWERVKAAIMEALKPAARENETEKGNDMDVTKAMFDELSGKVNDLAAQLDPNTLGKAIADAVTNALKPVSEKIEAIEAEKTSAAEAEKTELVNQVVKANLLTEEAAKGLPVPALRELAAKTVPGKAAALNAAFKGAGETHASGFKLPEGD